MNEFKDIFRNGRRHKNIPHRHFTSARDKYKGYLYRETKEEPSFLNKYDRDNFHVSQSTLNVSHHCKQISQSTLCVPYQQKSPSKQTLCSPNKLAEAVMDGDVASLPYYIVPVLYVPHKPLYEAKQMLEPKAYKAYHCKSKNHLTKGDRHVPKPSRSKSELNIHNKNQKKENDYSYVPKTEKYSFECYDEYFRRCIEGKKSSSDISFYTEKSYCNLPVTPKRSSKFDDTFKPSSERRRIISKDFPELFGVHDSKTTSLAYRPTTRDEMPTWDSPRTMNALIETEATMKSSISAQTSFERLKWRKRETQGTQTTIMDIKKNVVVQRKDVPRSFFDRYVLHEKQSEQGFEKERQKVFDFNRSSSRFTAGRLTKSFVLTKENSKKSIASGSMSVI